MNELGPVQVLIIEIADPRGDGSIMAEFARLTEAGVVRLLDMMIVEKDAAGAVSTVPGSFVGPTPGRGIAGEFFGIGLHADAASVGAADLRSGFAAAVPAGGMVAVALIEHLWAIPLRETILRAGGVALVDTWLGAADLADLTVLLERDGLLERPAQ